MQAKLFLTFFLFPVSAALLAPPTALAQQEAIERLEKEVKVLQEGQKRIQQQLQDITILLQRRRAAATPARLQTLKGVVLTIENDPFKGLANAKVVMVEFSDYQCPFCARHQSQVLPQLEREYVATGKLKYVFRDFPLETIHKQAFQAAQAANCAGDQEQFWAMHDELFANRSTLEPFSKHAQAIGLNQAQFEECLRAGKYRLEVRNDIKEALKIGIRSTPTFLLGVPEGDGSTVKGMRLIRGAFPFEQLKLEIDKILALQPD